LELSPGRQRGELEQQKARREKGVVFKKGGGKKVRREDWVKCSPRVFLKGEKILRLRCARGKGRTRMGETKGGREGNLRRRELVQKRGEVVPGGGRKGEKWARDIITRVDGGPTNRRQEAPGESKTRCGKKERPAHWTKRTFGPVKKKPHAPQEKKKKNRPSCGRWGNPITSTPAWGIFPFEGKKNRVNMTQQKKEKGKGQQQKYRANGKKKKGFQYCQGRGPPKKRKKEPARNTRSKQEPSLNSTSSWAFASCGCPSLPRLAGHSITRGGKKKKGWGSDYMGVTGSSSSPS